MCRWTADHGKPLVIDELLYRTRHGLVDQSLHSRMGAETTNGDGFGIGWYAELGSDDPGRYRSIEPAWNDANLRDLAGHLTSPLFLAHVRASIGSPVQQTNCHPFRHGPWLFMHNGFIDGFRELRRDLLLSLSEAQFEAVEGSTDSEVLFRLALTLGGEDDPLTGLARAIGVVEATGEAHGISHPMQGTYAMSDGQTLWAARYLTEHRSRSLFVSQDLDTLKRLHPDESRLSQLDETSRVVVSEPLSDLPGDWAEVPESSSLVVDSSGVTHHPFEPLPPT